MYVSAYCGCPVHSRLGRGTRCTYVSPALQDGCWSFLRGLGEMGRRGETIAELVVVLTGE